MWATTLYHSAQSRVPPRHHHESDRFSQEGRRLLSLAVITDGKMLRRSNTVVENAALAEAGHAQWGSIWLPGRGSAGTQGWGWMYHGMSQRDVDLYVCFCPWAAVCFFLCPSFTKFWVSKWENESPSAQSHCHDSVLLFCAPALPSPSYHLPLPPWKGIKTRKGTNWGDEL